MGDAAVPVTLIARQKVVLGKKKKRKKVDMGMLTFSTENIDLKRHRKCSENENKIAPVARFTESE